MRLDGHTRRVWRDLGFGWMLLAALSAALLVGCGASGTPSSPAPTQTTATTVPSLAPTAPKATRIPAGTVAQKPTPTDTPTAAAAPLPAKRILDVPILRQEYALSCEAAALRMAMGALGKDVTEQALLADLARDPTPRKLLPDGSVQWGNPNAGYVGEWDGVFLKDGYGVYEGPIAEVALANGFAGTWYGRETDPQRLYAAIREGYPAIAWVPYELVVKERGAWTTPLGKRIDYVVTEHAVVLAGVDEQGVYYADPMKPTLQRASYAAFEAAFDELDRRSVILRPQPPE